MGFGPFGGGGVGHGGVFIVGDGHGVEVAHGGLFGGGAVVGWLRGVEVLALAGAGEG